VKKTLGVILIVLGVFGLAWGGFTYTTQEKVVDIGPIHATRDETHSTAAAHRRCSGADWRHFSTGGRAEGIVAAAPAAAQIQRKGQRQ
jgi:hypothetical protein